MFIYIFCIFYFCIKIHMKLKFHSLYLFVHISALSVSSASKPSTSDMPKWGRRGSLMSKHINALCFLKAIQTDNRRQSISAQPSIQQHKRHSIVTTQTASRPKFTSELMPLQESRRQTITGHSLLSANRRHSLAVSQSPLDKPQQTFKFMQKRRDSTIPQRADDTCALKINSSTFKKKYSGKFSSIDFDDDYMSEPGDINEDNEDEEPLEKIDEFFGEEFYLSDQMVNYQSHIKGIKQILQQKKKDLIERREEAKRLKEEKAKSVKVVKLPELPKLKPEDLEAFRMHNETIKMPQELPSLEEFIKLLKCDEYYDPRYKNKVRQKSKKIAQRYYIAKGMHRSSILFNIGSIPDEIKNINTFRRGSRKQSTAPIGKQKEFAECKSKGHIARMLHLQESDGYRRNTLLQVSTIRGSDSLSNIQEQAQEVLGVTDSEPCKDHYIRGRQPAINENKEKDKSKEKDKDREDSIPCVKSPMFPRVRSPPPENDIESSDTDSYESSGSDNFEESFDTKKLNLKYSIERLRKKRRSKVKKRGGFIEVLAKYYNMQNAIKVFSKNSAGRGIKKGRLRAKPFGIQKQQGKCLFINITL